MFSGIGNQSGMFSQSYLRSFTERYGFSSNTTQSSTAADAAKPAAKENSEEVSAKEKFASILKEKGMSEEKIANLPESFWEKAEKKANSKKDFNFADDKQLQKLADFLAKKAETIKSYQDTGEATDTATISAEAKAAQEAANSTDEDVTATEEDSDIVTVETEEEEAAASQNPLEAFRDKLNQILLDGLGLGDLSELSGNNSVSAMSFSASFEISYSSMVAVAGENGMSMQETSFSLSASFEFMAMGQFGEDFDPFKSFNDSLSGLGDLFGFGNTKDTDETEESQSNDPLANLRDYFSPEKTADRILDFSLGFFGNSQQYKEGGNTEESRQSFADIIGAAIQKGFDQALGTLGKLPEKTQEEVDETHTRVFDGLDNFIKTGSKDDEDKYTGIQAYSSVFEMNYSSVTAYYSAEETGAALDSLYDKYFNNNYGTNSQQAGAEQATGEEQTYQTSPLDITA